MRMWWVVLVPALAGCLVIPRNSTAGRFVRDMHATDDGKLRVDACKVDYKATSWALVVPSGGAGAPSFDAVGDTVRNLDTSGCVSARLALPAGIFPDDGLDGVRPRWCQRSIDRWERAREAARLAELGQRRGACAKIVDGLRAQAASVATLRERRALYDAMPNCAALRPLDHPPSTPTQIAAWDAIPDNCQAFTGAVP